MSKTVEKKLSECIIARKGLFVMRDQVEKYVAKFDADEDACQIPVRLENLDRAYKEFLEVQSLIERYDTPENLDTHLAERADYETRYCIAKGFLLSKRSADQNVPLMNSTMNVSQSNPASFHLRVPKIDLPKFNGDYSRWLSFRDTFTSMIHSNADIPTVAKLQYLLQSLEGEARKPFESVDVEADNYATTWDALLKRYDNKRFLKRQLFRALYDLPPLKRESAQELHCLVDDFQRHVKALAKLHEPVDHWDTPLVNILSYKLDPKTLRAWEEKSSNDDEVSYEKLTEYLYQRVRMLKSVGNDLQQRSQQPVSAKVAGSHFSQSKSSKTSKVASNAATTQSKGSKFQCIVCSEKHFLFQCPTFSKMSILQRREQVSKGRLCWNCFRSGHMAQQCTSKFSCRVCHMRHHSLLHQDASTQSLSTPAIQSNEQQTPSCSESSKSGDSNSQVSLSVQSNHSTVLLETVELLLVDQNGKKHPARALLDSGSMCNFITKKLANTLNLRRKKVDIAVTGIGESKKQIKCQLTATIQSKATPFSAAFEFLILKRPTIELPTIPIDVSNWKFPEVRLADPKFHVPSDVDMVVGGESYHELHTGSKIVLGEGLPTLVETVFGWAVSGKVSIKSASIPKVCHLTTVDRNLEQALQRFWELEAIESSKVLSTEEAHCEEIYASTTTRDSSGRYIVRLPLTRDPLVTLGNSRSIAERQFYNLERRLERDPPTKDAYCRFMDEYERLNHMRRIDDPVDDMKPHCYLPHHPVFKESSTTTKTRVVFNASCKTASGFSVNEMQMIGPTVQEDLLSIIMRFRTHQIAVVADCEKMYRQVLIHPEDRSYQRILWRSSPDQPLATYELQTVTYGFAASAFLATRTLHQIAQDEATNFPDAVAAVKQDFYVDDFLSGTDDLQSAVKLRQQVSAMLLSAGFPLKKWASNVPEVLFDVPAEDLALDLFHDLKDGQSISVLGLVWEPSPDFLRFRIQLPLPAPVLTKRKIMSYIAIIFDPAGFSGPTIVVSKLFMQRLWALKTDDGHSYEWDRPLPPHLQAEWKNYHSTLDTLSNIRIPRCVFLRNAVSIQLHIFSDASEKAYGTCCYIRTESAEGVQVRLLTSKSKVAPLATHQSIARLELCGAEMSSKLYKKVRNSIKAPAQVFFWTDSMTVLQWIQACPSRLKTFVANRSSKIRSDTEVKDWNHVPGVSNPADVLSRGLNPTDLVNHSLWWNGPPWLSLSPTHWPLTELPNVEASTLPEARSDVAVMMIAEVDTPFSNWLFGLCSKYKDLRRITAYWVRYCRILRAAALKRKKSESSTPLTDRQEAFLSKEIKPFEFLTDEDLSEADIALCRLAQRDMFVEEAADLVSNDRVSHRSKLKTLNPKLYPDGVIRVGGRLNNSVLPEDVKHPIVLKSKHRLSSLLVEYYHENLKHGPPQLMLSTIRQRYWIVGGRNLVRYVYHQCHQCFRNKPRLVQQSIADLPSARVTPAKAFEICGVDYCGPVYIKSPIRNRAATKAYIAIFVCFSTRAVHIELVSDLTTQAFLSALRRMVARRSPLKEIHSDNGTVFKGASNVLHKIYEMLKTDQSSRKQIHDFCAEKNITWKFIPPRAPHFGGLWEAAVKSAKHHLLREIGSTSISYEDMCTLLCEIEMCLNSRPLVPLSADPTDLEVLTPGHFLVGTNMQAIPEHDLKDVPDNRLSHWELTQKRFQRIWSRWYPEYLQQLQARAAKGCKPPVAIDVGRVVIIREDNLPPNQWPLGRITKLHPGKDGVVRVVTLNTKSARDVVRPVARLALLPVKDEPEPLPVPAPSD